MLCGVSLSCLRQSHNFLVTFGYKQANALQNSLNQLNVVNSHFPPRVMVAKAQPEDLSEKGIITSFTPVLPFS